MKLLEEGKIMEKLKNLQDSSSLVLAFSKLVLVDSSSVVFQYGSYSEATRIEQGENVGGGDSDSEMLNLEKELYSLTHYADDVEELVSQMFTSIKGTKLQAMLPPILKEIPLIDVQQLCLHELRGMSSRRILSIINGVEMSDSSSEDDDLLDRKLIKNEAESKNVKEDFSQFMDADALKDIALPDDPNLTELDVLELEMRAKLIKTMLSKPGDESGEENDLDEAAEFDPAIKIKEEPHTSDEDAGRKGRRRSRKHRGSSSSSSRSSSSRSYSSRSYSSSGSHSASTGSDKSDDSDARKYSKKKITKKEFEARMKKARMNRTYRKRKDSDDDSANESRRRQRRRKKNSKVQEQKEPPVPDSVESDALKENEIVEKEEDEVIITEQKEAELEIDLTEKEKEEPPEEEVLEKEEGELDSNEEKSYDSSSYSSRSYSSSPKRHRRSKKKRSRRHRSKTRSPSVPKVPNWEAGSKSALPKKAAKVIEEIKTLPLTEDRASVSFSLSKKIAPVVAADPNLQDEPVIKKLEKVTLASADNSVSAINNEPPQESLSAKPKQEAPVSESTENVNDEPDCISISDGEEDGAISENSDGEMEVDEPSAPLEEESRDVSEALEEGTNSEATAEEISQDIIDEAVDDQASNIEDPTEIIGVIDPMDDNASAAFNDCLSGSSWSTRWLQSEKVQQVVSDSKMLSKMRKNIQAKGKGRAKKTLLKPAAPSPVLESKVPAAKLDTKPKKPTGGIGGNAEDYENVFGIKLKVPVCLPAPKTVKPTIEPSTQVKAKSLAATLLDSDEDDDSEDDELWSKIMKK